MAVWYAVRITDSEQMIQKGSEALWTESARQWVSESESLLLPWAVDIEAFCSWIQQSWTTFTRANNMSAIVPAARKATAAVSDVIIAILPSDFGV